MPHVPADTWEGNELDLDQRSHETQSVGASRNGTSKSLRTRAVLVFAQTVSMDLGRRGWPKQLQVLLKTPSVTSTSMEGVDVHFFGCHCSEPSRTRADYFHRQQGASFAERLENAIETLARLGYDQIVVVGRDCPDLEISEITQAFSLLKAHGLVLGPDHRGGCYLIAFHVRDRFRLKHVRWQRNSDCRELQERFGCEATFLLPVKYDLDSLSDIRLLSRSCSHWRTVAKRLLNSLALRFKEYRPRLVDSSSERMRLRWQLPPPVRHTF